MIRLYRTPFSTNVERVALALGHKRLEVESVLVDPDDAGHPRLAAWVRRVDARPRRGTRARARTERSARRRR